MTRILIVLLLQFVCIISLQGQTDTDEIILARYKEYLFRTTLPAQTLGSWVHTIDADGKWPDINYQDTSLADWKITIHLKRIRELALAWAQPESDYHRDREIRKKINSTLDHWLERKYQSKNWWYNEIGVPQYMRDIIVLLKNDLDSARLQESLNVLAQLKVRDNYVAGNLIWCADLGLHYGALVGDKELISKCRELIIKEIKIGAEEGVQPDFSFHQHGKRLQMYQYGKAFLWESLRVVWELRNTNLAFPTQKVDILVSLLTEGWQWMARGIHTVPGTMDRSSSREGELRSADIRLLLPFVMELDLGDESVIKKMQDVQNDKGSLIGYRYFPYSDFAAHHRPGFSFFLKSISTRTLPTESINNENLKGRLLNSGDAYLIRNGDEYYNLMPAWDWGALPGLTVFTGANQVDRRSFVGSVSDGIDGLAAMDYVLQNETGDQEFSAHKFWASYKDVVVCLIGNMKGKNLTGEVYTSLDQSRLQGEVTVNSSRNILTPGMHNVDTVRWIHHAGFAYIPLQLAPFTIKIKKVQSSWNTINAAAVDTLITDSVFLPQMRHSLHPGDSTGYVLALSKTPKDAKRIAQKRSWKVLQNGDSCQAVTFIDGVVMASFYSPSALKLGKKRFIQVDQPCLLLLKDNALYISDPTHDGKMITITLEDKVIKVQLPDDGSTRRLTI